MLNKYDPDSTDYLVNVVLYTTATDDELNGKPKTKTWKKLKVIYPGQAVIQPLKLIDTSFVYTVLRDNFKKNYKSVSNFLNLNTNKRLTISEVSLGRL